MAEKTSKTTWFVLGVCLVIAGIVVTTRDDVIEQSKTCPPISAGALWLPPTHAHYLPNLERLAMKVNASGRCVVEGSWGASSQKFYLAVKRPNAPDRTTQNVTYTETEVARY